MFSPEDEKSLRSLWSWLRQQKVSDDAVSYLQEATSAALDLSVDRRLADWRAAVEAIPEFFTEAHELGPSQLALHGKWSDHIAAEQALQQLHPWRKGPIRFGDLLIDTEWRSDWKWSRISPYLNLEGARVLDVGCGNGYHSWRALGAGARAVLGVDPMRLFHYQNRAIAKLFNQEKSLETYHLPLPLEALDATPLPLFDVILSMGVLYHRREPQAHLRALQQHFSPQGGELLLETLITTDDHPLDLEGRYARMRNIWQLPDRETLLMWVREAGYREVRIVNENQTTFEEQRQTDWMRFYSLRQALDPEDHHRTIEGHPAPYRVAIHAMSP